MFSSVDLTLSKQSQFLCTINSEPHDRRTQGEKRAGRVQTCYSWVGVLTEGCRQINNNNMLHILKGKENEL